jgi:ketosteroid isomerase-like protein
VTPSRVDEVGRAADRLVAAFAGHDVAGYFDAFDPDATFLFHSSPRLLGSRAEYEAEWAAWEAEGFRVLGCHTRERRIDLVSDDVAVMTHRVRTSLAGSADVACERETIVFRRSSDARWLAVHEHLSPDPEGAE